MTQNELNELFENAGQTIFTPEQIPIFLKCLHCFKNQFVVENCMLIFSQYPDAKMLKSFDDWKLLQADVLRGASAINLASFELTKEKLELVPKAYFDITQTNSILPRQPKKSFAVKEIYAVLQKLHKIKFVQNKKSNASLPYQVAMNMEIDDAVLKIISDTAIVTLPHLIGRAPATWEVNSFTYLVCSELGFSPMLDYRDIPAAWIDCVSLLKVIQSSSFRAATKIITNIRLLPKPHTLAERIKSVKKGQL